MAQTLLRNSERFRLRTYQTGKPTPETVQKELEEFVAYQARIIDDLKKQLETILKDHGDRITALEPNP